MRAPELGSRVRQRQRQPQTKKATMDFGVSCRKVTLANGQQAAVAEVVGEVDIYTAPLLKDALLGVESGGIHRIVLDLSRVGFIDSVGLGVLLGGLRRARSGGGDMVLAGPGPRTGRILDVTGLCSAFTVTADVESGLQVLSESCGGSGAKRLEGCER